MYYVDTASTAATPDGASWATAYPDLQDALTVASAGDEIWLVAGTYHPIEPADPQDVTPDERERAFQIANEVSLHGGLVRCVGILHHSYHSRQSR